MTANKHPSSGGRAKFSRPRLVPLIVVVVASGVVIAMGWQRQLSFETLARHYAALREFIAAHEVSAVAAEHRDLMKGDPLRGVHAFYASSAREWWAPLYPGRSVGAAPVVGDVIDRGSPSDK